MKAGTEDALVKVTDCISQCKDKGKKSLIEFLDVAKAFDCLTPDSTRQVFNIMNCDIDC